MCCDDTFSGLKAPVFLESGSILGLSLPRLYFNCLVVAVRKLRDETRERCGPVLLLPRRRESLRQGFHYISRNGSQVPHLVSPSKQPSSPVTLGLPRHQQTTTAIIFILPSLIDVWSRPFIHYNQPLLSSLPFSGSLLEWTASESPSIRTKRQQPRPNSRHDGTSTTASCSSSNSHLGHHWNCHCKRLCTHLEEPRILPCRTACPAKNPNKNHLIYHRLYDTPNFF